MKNRKIVVASSGASGVNLGLKTLKLLPKEIDKHFIMTKNSQIVLDKEMNITLHEDQNIAASISSGSFGVDAMIIAPCSMNTLAKIACGISDNLVTRCASVMIKEHKKLILAPREMPFSAIALENMHKLATLGVIIAPPVMAYYSEQQTLDEMENFIIGKWFDLLGIENNLYKRWE
ncbi:MAG: 3-octaprenyl-4-hydroxybenzoate carboxy-lyase [Sulfurimonas sp. RIFOXYD12_FULL_33_39]|uniref:UbiX family flavin prenyltransferase n=1 Tax=unclassified Sulfurimonas TaxID=2623549 RepID=UPI0008C951D8|nr:MULTISPECIES: UbiX family flavin prenyltransferase [unclassified Sulfurimonas]OHE01580.1 MAG: 3-octaprenyl-4-hydroxybenzoate carboxy-lyase [Sulfurimonas sp. RIFCSPLOWO2_12_FULL_34_6]OHE09334.1 MAG: 3-octaprenyl-4-hydroxybenzoate carboxy-lyase [Sulfurimonas sp. RIFOXYD12_FULL_33_39]OHE12883.1 MAG: 3-octaprenyl-4-hydroxybenzoate carboxy-lyase [Sulfurimonas sp. RIFOXYD2_FULL_34_21]DAB27295.1 MAG TPA: 3-octaprenyl-4-hydroxybenzoate carboxy-lyase [Sulfurimonas sp. UBA10385]